ncbi:N-acetyltransferase family protein [Thiomicrorhabdus sp.]|uniref:GNAT family N-acetyltransferase n=1 Tax=Thiomicrorhabdus sp. TaxID=2039724 RepID=UPI00356199BE
MHIRRAVNSEISDVVELIGDLLNEIMEVMGQPFFQFERERAIEQAQKFLEEEKYFVLVACDGNKVVGMISAYESYALYAQGAFGTIPECYVIPEYRGQSVGKRLIEAMIEFARHKNWHRLEVTTPPLPEFADSLRFYEQNGFEISGGKKLKISL